MENFNFWLTIATAVLPSTITAFISFLASRSKNKSDIEALEKQFNHEMDALDKKHQQELESQAKSHNLKIEELKATYQFDAEKQKSNLVNELAMKALTGEVNLDTIFSISQKAESFNKKQLLQKQYVQKNRMK